MITRRLLRPSAQSRPSAWTCPSCAVSKVNSQWATPGSSSPIQPPQTRGIRMEPKLSHESTFQEHGVTGLFSKKGYELAWTQYQKTMVEKVNQLTAGDVHEDTPVKELALQFARDPMNAALFNHASMAFNNHFFFSTFAPDPQPLEEHRRLADSLVATFGSLDTLRKAMIDQAAGMFGPGFVWLVWARDVNSSASDGASASTSSYQSPRSGKWRLLNTYLAGTPFPEAGYRQQSIDTATANAGSYNSYLIDQPAYLLEKHREQHARDERARAQQAQNPAAALPPSAVGGQASAAAAYAQQPVNHVGAFGPNSRSGRELAKLPPGGTNLMPVLCVNTWEHVWLYDFGISGKRKYLADWWAAVDWGAVEQNAPIEAKTRTRQDGLINN